MHDVPVMSCPGMNQMPVTLSRVVPLLIPLIVAAADYDVLIRNGCVVDGSGAKAVQADVAIASGKISAIGRLSVATARMFSPGGGSSKVNWPQHGHGNCSSGGGTADRTMWPRQVDEIVALHSIGAVCPASACQWDESRLIRR
jgi:hypothetical protein